LLELFVSSNLRAQQLKSRDLIFRRGSDETFDACFSCTDTGSVLKRAFASPGRHRRLSLPHTELSTARRWRTATCRPARGAETDYDVVGRRRRLVGRGTLWLLALRL